MNKLRKIVVTGPESTGKSTLTEALARHYDTLWVPEYAREFLTNYQNPYGPGEVEVMARGQISVEEKMALSSLNDLLFIDTDLITYKIWFEHKYGKVPRWILEEISLRSYDHYLLCCPDLPWEFDPLRENPGRGEFFFEWFKKELVAAGKTFTLISGQEEERLRSAVAAVESR